MSYPLYYDHPREESAYDFARFELRDDRGVCDTNAFKPKYHQSLECLQLRPKSVGYGWGPSFIVFPVTFWSDRATGIAKQDIWAPPGTYVHFQSGRSLTGPRVYANETFGPDSIPAYAEANAVIPMQRFGSNATVVAVVLAAGGAAAPASATAQLYEDDGSSLRHLDGAFVRHRITHTADGKGKRVVAVSRAAGAGYAGEPTRREWIVEFRPGLMIGLAPTLWGWPVWG
jgi:hypothetical protein